MHVTGRRPRRRRRAPGSGRPSSSRRSTAGRSCSTRSTRSPPRASTTSSWCSARRRRDRGGDHLARRAAPDQPAAAGRARELAAGRARAPRPRTRTRRRGPRRARRPAGLRPEVIEAVVAAAAVHGRCPSSGRATSATAPRTRSSCGGRAWALADGLEGDRGLGPLLAAHPELVHEVARRGLDPGRRHPGGPRGGRSRRHGTGRTRGGPMTAPERPAGKRSSGDATPKPPRPKKARASATPETTTSAPGAPAKDPATLEAAWAERVRANREQAERFRETQGSDFYAPGLRAVRRRPAAHRRARARRPRGAGGLRTRPGSTSAPAPAATPCRSPSGSAR